jgi:class 3 adenylate cyclase
VAAGTATPVRSPAPGTYTPKHLAEKILTSKAALEGERKQVTVLFADLKGSMELVADRDPEEARKLLDPVLERMMEAVHRYEGTVNQVMGDGIMALFGAPLAHEDHAVRACYAALRMQELVKGYADEMRRAHGITVRIRVGLNSGEVVVRAIGSDLHMDYTAVGQTTHLAARMEQLADPGSILVSPATLELAGGYVEVRSLGPVPVKGLPEAVEVYELTGAGTARSRLQAAAARGLTPFVGRDPELAHLIRAQEQARTGQGQLVAIVGEAGVGKSRLYHEFTHSHRVQGWLVLQASAVSHGKSISYLPIIDLLKSYCKLEARDDHRALRGLLASTLAERGEFAEGLIHGKQGLQIAEEVRHPYSLILMCWGVALLCVLKGELSRASVHLERALALCRDWTVPVLSPVTTGFLGYVNVLTGQVEEGLSALQQGTKDQESSGLALYHSRLILWLGEASMRANRLDDGLALAERAIMLTRDRGERGLQAWALWLLGEVGSRGESAAVRTTETHYQQAIALAEDIGLRPLVARCHNSLGKLYQHFGRRERAQEQLIIAMTMYRQMDMRFWLAQAEAEVRELA